MEILLEKLNIKSKVVVSKIFIIYKLETDSKKISYYARFRFFIEITYCRLFYKLYYIT